MLWISCSKYSKYYYSKNDSIKITRTWIILRNKHQENGAKSEYPMSLKMILWSFLKGLFYQINKLLFLCTNVEVIICISIILRTMISNLVILYIIWRYELKQLKGFEFSVVSSFARHYLFIIWIVIEAAICSVNIVTPW